MKLGGFLAVLLLVPFVPIVAAAEASSVGLGMDMGSVAALQDAGAPPAYGSFWIGSWTATYGWDALDKSLRTALEKGVTPVVYWYYWGDSISPACVEDGCDGKTKAQWVQMTTELATRVNQVMGSEESLIVLENEFNKQGITSSTYAPTFDAYLEARASEIKAAAPAAKIVLGYGAWGEAEWSRFPKAIAASDLIGFQMMRGETRDSEESYRGAPDKIAQVLTVIEGMSGKGAFLYDLALSSYPDAQWTTVQAETLASILERRTEYASRGLGGIVYRELRDNPNMSPANYFGYAEQHWGLWSGSTKKPAWAAWAAAYSPSPLPSPSPSVPASFEGEAMSASTGVKQSDALASGGAVWNLWTNGDVTQPFSSQSGVHRVTISARGQPAAGVDARMELRVDGAAVAAWAVPRGLASYTTDVALPASGALSVAFTNDALVATEDRNLYVDVVRVELPPVNRAPVASFDASSADLTVTVASTSSDPDGDPLSLAWDFGDGATATGATASHTYASAGTFTVTLTASDGKAASTATRVVSATQPNRAPSAAFTVAGAELSWSFDARSSSDADGDALTYAWTFGDGSTASGAQASHAYASAGTFTVTLTVSDGEASSTATRQVTATQAPFQATFSNPKGNEWWVQVDVSSTRALSSVCASVDGGACQPLTKQVWGAWAASFRAPAGSDVRFRAVATTGEAVWSIEYDWPTARPALHATFSPYGGNEWWVQARVTADQQLKSVCVSLNGGACKPLTLRSWGAWAASLYAPTGTRVVFVATGMDGQVVRSATYTWPVR